MKILLINGSPKGKNSNTYKLANAFISGIKEKQNIDLDEISINNLEINHCLGCFSCWKKTPGKCVIKDDMQEIINKLLQADITIWSFPLYYFSVPSKLKALIDRLLPTVLPFMDKDSQYGGHKSRYNFSNQKNILISTCGFYTTENNYDAIISMFNHLLGENNYEKIFCAQGELFRVPELSSRTNEYLEYVKTAGYEFINDKISSMTKQKLSIPLFPKEIYESMADTSWGVEKETGNKLDESLIFTKQMAALYNKNSYKGKEIVLEMKYTDINKTYQIILNEKTSIVLTENFKPFTTKIETPYTVWCDIASNKISGEDALMKQMYKVKGDFNLMINWNSYFGHQQINHQENNKPKPNMLIMLLPWIIFWISVPINTYYGSLISILSCLIISLLFFKNKKTIYDIISNSIIILLATISLINYNNIIISISYFCFGLMWLLSCLHKIPLTAHYSAEDYNGDEALNNPLFIKTNRILTIMWGILYIITSIMSYFLLQTPLSSYLGIINNILPILMGIFTAWFQKWYPAKIAEGR